MMEWKRCLEGSGRSLDDEIPRRAATESVTRQLTSTMTQKPARDAVRALCGLAQVRLFGLMRCWRVTGSNGSRLEQEQMDEGNRREEWKGTVVCE